MSEHKTFERAWEEFIKDKRQEFKKNGIGEEIVDVCIMELEDHKNEHIDFYLNRRVKEGGW